MIRRRASPGSSCRRPASPVAVTLAGLAALAVAIGIGRFAFTPLLPMMQQDAGLSIAHGGWLASANYGGYLLGAVTAMAVRVPAVWGIRAGLAVIGLVTLGMGLEHRLAGWIVLRSLAGVASAWVLIGVSAHCLARLAPLRRPFLSSTVFAGVGTGIAATGGLCVILMRADVGSAPAWVGLGVAAVAVTVVTWPVFRGGPGEAPAATGRAPAAGGAGAMRLVLCYGAFGFGYIIPATFLPVLARDVIRDPAVFGWAWPIFGAAAAGSTLVVAMIQRRVEGRRIWVAAQVVMAVGVGLPVVWSGPAAVVLAGVLVGGTFMVITLVGMQEAQQAAGPQSARLMSAMTAAFAVGQIAGPASVSMLVGPDGDLSAALLIASGLLATSAGALASGGGSGRRPWRSLVRETPSG